MLTIDTFLGILAFELACYSIGYRDGKRDAKKHK